MLSLEVGACANAASAALKQLLPCPHLVHLSIAYSTSYRANATPPSTVIIYAWFTACTCTPLTRKPSCWTSNNKLHTPPALARQSHGSLIVVFSIFPHDLHLPTPSQHCEATSRHDDLIVFSAQKANIDCLAHTRLHRLATRARIDYSSKR